MSSNKYIIINHYNQLEELKKLKEELKKSKRPGDIVWAGNSPESSDAFSLRREIEDILVKNNLDYERFPSDHTHGLLCLGLYENTQAINDWNVFKEREHAYKDIVLSKARIYVNELQKQMVLVHSGFLQDPFQLLIDSGDNVADFKTITADEILPQLTACFELVREATSKASSEGFNLSFTGFSNGAWLAEYSLYFCHKFLNFSNSRAVLFQSPGSIRARKETKEQCQTNDSFMKNSSDLDLNELDIINYLDSPILANALGHAHSGKVIRLLTVGSNYDNEKHAIEKELTGLIIRGAKEPAPLIYKKIIVIQSIL